MKNIYIKYYWQAKEKFSVDSWHWKFLCVTMDNEALGFLERLLTEHKFEFKVEDR